MIEGVYQSIKHESNLHNFSELGETCTVAGRWRKPPRHPRDLVQIRRNQSRKVETMVFRCAITNVGKPEHQGPRTSRLLLFHMSIEVRNVVFRLFQNLFPYACLAFQNEHDFISYSCYGPTKIISVHSLEHIFRYCEYLAEFKETILD